MKKAFLILCISMVFTACGNKSQSSSASNDSIAGETSTAIDESEVAEAEPENVLIKLSKPATDWNRNAYEVEVRLLEDGTASFQMITIEPKNYPEPDEDPFYRDTVNQNGSWKEISVKRGKVYLDAYDIGITSGDLYCTEKFDYLWGIADDMPYIHFSDGQTGYAWKINSVEKY